MSREAKHDEGKPRLSLVPLDMLYMIARVREYGTEKYHDPENWKTVEPERYKDALLRHMAEWTANENSVDEESGLPHFWHMMCNMAFLAWFWRCRNE